MRLPEPEAVVGDGVVSTDVTYVDSFGNVRLAGGPDTLAAAFGPLDDGRTAGRQFGGGEPCRRHPATPPTFGAVPLGASLVYVDSLGNLAMADNQGNLAARLGVGHDRPVRIIRG